MLPGQSTGAILLGGIAGVIVVIGVEVLEWLRIDDPIGAVPVHGFCGFGARFHSASSHAASLVPPDPFRPTTPPRSKQFSTAAGLRVRLPQAIGSAIITLSTFGVALAVMYAVNALGVLRVSEEGEAYGLDLHEHGISAYPGYLTSSAGRPSGTGSIHARWRGRRGHGADWSKT